MNTPTSVAWLESMFRPDAMLQFAIDDGRVMTWEAGHRIDCRVSFPSVVPGYFT